ncbi:MAG: alcohol dehydrogenase catalytic domain-containing protein, partial [Jatrophihabitantaceae bacterium]
MTLDRARAVTVTEHGGPDVLQVRRVPIAPVGPGQLLIDVAASGVNFIDVYQREGIYPGHVPFGLGIECAGRVLAAGADVTEFGVGDVIATADGSATHADVARVTAAACVPVPPGLAPELAAAAMLQGMTAHYLINSTFAVN